MICRKCSYCKSVRKEFIELLYFSNGTKKLFVILCTHCFDIIMNDFIKNEIITVENNDNDKN